VLDLDHLQHVEQSADHGKLGRKFSTFPDGLRLM